MISACSGPLSRRTFLRVGSLGVGGLGLPGLGRTPVQARAIGSSETTATSVIRFWMWGGPSQFEPWDPKPNAPEEVRGPFKPIRTTVPGMDFCELFPLQARLTKWFVPFTTPCRRTTTARSKC